MKRLLPFAAGAAACVLGANWLMAGVAPSEPASVLAREEPSVRIAYPAAAPARIELPDGRHEQVYSLLNVKGPMRFGDFRWNEEGVPEGPIWVRVDLAAQTVSVFRAGHEIGTAVILYGTDGYPTPIGTFQVLEKDKDRWSRSYDAPMPYMLRLTDDGVAIHASDVTKGFATHGCIGVPMGFARRLFAQMKKGDTVFIMPSLAA